MRKVFLDTETTGLAPGQIGQLSMIIEEDTGEVIGKNYFFDIDYLSEDAAKVTNRTLDFYREASKGKKFKDYSAEIYELLKDSIVIAHNLKFDENFLSAEFWRLNTVFKPAQRFDTMEYFKEIVNIQKNGKAKNPKLSELAGHFSINNDKVKEYAEKLFSTNIEGFHDAMFDTTVMYVAFCIHRDDLNKVEESPWRKKFTEGE